MNLAFTDTETTGTEEHDRLLQLAYKCGGKEVNELFNPGVPINLVAMATHHITEEMVADKPKFKGSEQHKFLKKRSKEMVFVAHNAKFDMDMLARDGISGWPAHICTLKVARYLDDKAKLECYKLQYLRYLFKLKVEAQAHDAWGDILVLEAVFWKLHANMMRRFDFEDDAACIAEMMVISSKPSMIRKWAFGKHRDEMIEDTLETDRGYLEWMLGEKQKENKPDDEDLIYTLETLLER